MPVWWMEPKSECRVRGGLGPRDKPWDDSAGWRCTQSWRRCGNMRSPNLPN